jgi:putative ABC transport system permease protein
MALPLKYNWKNLFVRRMSNAMTAGAIALVVAVFVAAMAMVAGLDAAVKDTSTPGNVILLHRGADSEYTSRVTLETLEAMRFLPAIKRDSAGQPLVSPELAEQIFMTGNDQTLDNLPIRGLLAEDLKVHENVRLIAGRMFAPGLDEVIIGKAIVNQYPGCTLGGQLPLGRRTWKVVGVFEAAGSSFESEVWADLHRLQDDSGRSASFNSIRLQLAPGADQEAFARRAADDPRLNLEAKTEAVYYQEQSVYAARLRVVGLAVAGVMAFAAIFAAMNTMYAAVSARTAEIGTLRALGFRPGAILTSFLVESSLLSLCAGIAGILLALPVNGLSTKFNGVVSSPTLAFQFHITAAVIAEALVFAFFIGLAGGWLPARQAIAVSVVNALRRK